MIAGHFGLAAAVKSRAPGVPLWSLMLATVWMDVLFVPLLLAGLEPMEVLPGTRGGYGQAVIHADFTHSLLGALLIAAAFGAVAAALSSRKTGAVLAGVVFSHWLLDLPMHHADLPLWPGHGAGVRLGLGLWSHPGLSAALELAIVLVGAWLYWRRARALAPADARTSRGASISAAAVLATGVVTLGLNLLGM